MSKGRKSNYPERPLTIHQSNSRRRRSSDSVWPLRGADGKTFAERKLTESLLLQSEKD